MLLIQEINIIGRQNDILMGAFINLYECELKKLDYNIKTIDRYSGFAKRPYQSGSIPWEFQYYSSEISAKWINDQRKRLNNDEISLEQFLLMENSIDACEEFRRAGKFKKTAKHRVYEKYVPPGYKIIHKDFLDTFENILAPRTIMKHDTNCRHFLKYLEERAISKIRYLEPLDVENFLKQTYPEHRGSMSSMVHTVTLLLNFLKERNYIDFSLDCKMLKPAARRSPVLPCFSHEEVSEILSVIDTSTRNGKRDYAIILLAARTGLRSSDIFNLKLHEIDWKNSQISITQIKTANSLLLPLLPDAGNAVANYILHGRPETDEEYVFLRNVAPFVKLEGHCSGNTILKRYLSKVTFKWESCSGKSFHAFRRSIGSWMSQEGTPLSTIAEVLGHKSMSSTKSYLSYNHSSMVQCCLGLDEIPVSRVGLL